jgi:hypothetical protein
VEFVTLNCGVSYEVKRKDYGPKINLLERLLANNHDTIYEGNKLIFIILEILKPLLEKLQNLQINPKPTNQKLHCKLRAMAVISVKVFNLVSFFFDRLLLMPKLFCTFISARIFFFAPRAHNQNLFSFSPCSANSKKLFS